MELITQPEKALHRLVWIGIALDCIPLPPTESIHQGVISHSSISWEIAISCLDILILCKVWQMKNWARKIYITWAVFGLVALAFHFHSNSQLLYSPNAYIALAQKLDDVLNPLFSIGFLVFLFHPKIRKLFKRSPLKTFPPHIADQHKSPDMEPLTKLAIERKGLPGYLSIIQGVLFTPKIFFRAFKEEADKWPISKSLCFIFIMEMLKALIITATSDFSTIEMSRVIQFTIFFPLAMIPAVLFGAGSIWVVSGILGSKATFRAILTVIAVCESFAPVSGLLSALANWAGMNTPYLILIPFWMLVCFVIGTIEALDMKPVRTWIVFVSLFLVINVLQGSLRRRRRNNPSIHQSSLSQMVNSPRHWLESNPKR